MIVARPILMGLSKGQPVLDQWQRTLDWEEQASQEAMEFSGGEGNVWWAKSGDLPGQVGLLFLDTQADQKGNGK